jgi:hypothetical protein
MTAGRSNHWAEYTVGMKGTCRDYVRIVGRHRGYRRRSLNYYAGSSLHRKIPRTQRAQGFYESGDIASQTAISHGCWSLELPNASRVAPDRTKSSADLAEIKWSPHVVG